MQKKSIRNFDPDIVAKFETEMWQAYYHHNFLKLLLLLRRLMHSFIGFGFTRSLQASYYAVMASALFRLNRGKENESKILKNLVKFYRLVKNESGENFDISAVSQAELEWWLVDRYPNQYAITRREAIAKAAGLIYDIDPAKLSTYSDSRANAMEIQDRAEQTKQEVDWKEIEAHLRKAYKYLRGAI